MGSAGHLGEENVAPVCLESVGLTNVAPKFRCAHYYLAIVLGKAILFYVSLHVSLVDVYMKGISFIRSAIVVY